MMEKQGFFGRLFGQRAAEPTTATQPEAPAQLTEPPAQTSAEVLGGATAQSGEQKTMRAAQLQEFGDYDQIRLVELPVPSLEPGQVLVRMTAAALNPLDNRIRQGLFPLAGKPPMILGNEGAGILVDGEAELPHGTPVFFKSAYNLPHGGTWQEYVVCRPSDLLPIPASKSDREAAALRTAFQTGQVALTAIGGFQPGQIVLAPGVGGAVGGAVVQLARAQGAARVLTTATSTAKAERARELGSEDVIDLSQESLADGVRRLVGDGVVDLVIDGVGGPLLDQELGILKRGGAVVLLGVSGGEYATIDLERHMLQRGARILSFMLQTQPMPLRERALAEVLQLWTDSKIAP
ncbi:MAG TPA: zinc-binding alcohol dehydrogenase family protein, partial [Ktedonobacterales bacterium]|nr:zinc-binding alcohol dehydrogenase family protein [Ktedonobacterales bacterium]